MDDGRWQPDDASAWNLYKYKMVDAHPEAWSGIWVNMPKPGEYWVVKDYHDRTHYVRCVQEAVGLAHHYEVFVLDEERICPRVREDRFVRRLTPLEQLALQAEDDK